MEWLEKILFLNLTVFDVIIFFVTMFFQCVICALWYKMGKMAGYDKGFDRADMLNNDYFLPKIRELATEIEAKKRTIAQLKLEKEQLATEKEQLLDQNANYEKTCEGLRRQIEGLNSGTVS